MLLNVPFSVIGQRFKAVRRAQPAKTSVKYSWGMELSRVESF